MTTRWRRTLAVAASLIAVSCLASCGGDAVEGIAKNISRDVEHAKPPDAGTEWLHPVHDVHGMTPTIAIQPTVTPDQFKAAATSILEPVKDEDLQTSKEYVDVACKAKDAYELANDGNLRGRTLAGASLAGIKAAETFDLASKLYDADGSGDVVQEVTSYTLCQWAASD